MKYYYASPDNKTTGPVSVEEIQALIKSGTLKADPMVVPEGSSDWRPLSAYLTNPPGSGTPPPPPPTHHAAMAADKALAASKDAMTAFKIFATNPVGGLPAAHEALGPARAFQAGIAFGVISVVILVLMAYRITSSPFSNHDFDFFMKSLLFAIVPFASAFIIGMGARMAFGGKGGFDQDLFIAGASVLPLAAAALITTVLGASGGNFNLICSVFGLCLTVLMLFSGFTRISKVSERVATFTVPCVIIAIGYALSKMVMGLMFSGMGGGGMPGF